VLGFVKVVHGLFSPHYSEMAIFVSAQSAV